MDKLCNYIDEELEEIEEKVSQGGKLSGAELEYADKLAHLKKSILTNEAMEDSYSGMYYRENGQSMANNGGRGGRGGRGNSRAYYEGTRRNYSRGEAREDFREQLEDLMNSAPDEHSRRKVEKLMNEMR
jgi:CRISPR/Cas system CSM-associated protein Csm2 small subunit